MYIRRKNTGAGRKGAYKKDMPERAFKLALLGLTDADLATAFGVATNTITYWKQQKPGFGEALKKGRVEADAKVAHAMYKRAIGYSHPDTVILTDNVTEYNKEGKPVRSYKKPLKVPVIKHYPPDSYACNKWLAIRQRDYWAEVQKTEHLHKFTGQVDINHIMDQIGDAERFTDAELKLALKLGLDQARKNQPVLDN